MDVEGAERDSAPRKLVRVLHGYYSVGLLCSICIKFGSRDAWTVGPRSVAGAWVVRSVDRAV